MHAILGRRGLDRLIAGGLLIAVWWLASIWVGAYWISSPPETLGRLVAMIRSDGLLRHTGYTLAAAGLGFVLGGLPGVLLPIALRRHPFLQEVLDPYLTAGYGLPKLALAPLFILWFGIGMASKVALVVSVVFFIVFFSTQAGVRQVDPQLVRMARVAGASEWQVARQVVWPSIVPYVFAGFRIATPYAIGGVIISELVSSNRGLGYLVQYGAMSYSTPDIFAAVAAITVVIGIATWAVGLLERRLLRWRPPGAGLAAGAGGFQA